VVNLTNTLLATDTRHGTKNSITLHSFKRSSSYEERTNPAKSSFYLRNRCLF